MALNVEVDFKASTAQFYKSVDKLNGRLDKFSDKAQKSASLLSKFALGGAALGGLAVGFNRLIRSTIDYGDALQKASVRLNTTARDVAGLKGLAAEADVDFNRLSRSIQRAQTQLSKGGADAKFLKSIGVDAKDGRELLLQLSAAYNQLGTETEKTNLLYRAFGESGTRLRTIFEQTTSQIDGTINSYAELSGVTDETAKASAEFNDALNVLSAQWEGFRNRFVTPMISGLSNILEVFQELAGIDTYASKIKKTLQSFTAVDLDFGIDKIKGKIADLEQESKRAGRGRRSTINGEITKLKQLLGIYDKQKQRLIELSKVTGSVDTSNDGKKPPKPERTNRKPTVTKVDTDSQVVLFDEATKAAERYKQSLAQIAEEAVSPLARLEIQLSLNRDAQEKYGFSIEKLQQLNERAFDSYAATNPALQEYNSRLEEAKVYIESLITPTQSLEIELDKIKSLFEEGLIDDAQAEAGINNLLKRFDELNGSGKKSIGELSDFAGQAASNMESAFSDFLFDPFEKGLDGMLKSFAKTLAKMAAQAAASQAFKAISNGIGSLFGSANGDAFTSAGKVNYFANGGVVDSPTAFSFGGGSLGVMGEAGPEAILPLKRGSDGKLGVVADSSGGSISVQTTVNVKDSTTDPTSLGKMINSAIKQALISEKRTGGLLA